MISKRDKGRDQEKILDVDASMQGTLIFKDAVNLRINGRFEGVLNTKGNLMIGERASVSADITGESIIVAGTVNGNINAAKDLKLIAPARVAGDITTPVLSVAEGAAFDGSCKMLGVSAGGANQPEMNADDVAKYLEIDTALVHEWASSGRLPGIREGASWKFERSRIDDWIAQGKIK